METYERKPDPNSSSRKFSSLVKLNRHALAPISMGMFLCVGSAAADTSIFVATSIKPVHSIVSAVMEGVGEPHLLMRGAGSPHDFSLRPSDAAWLEKADVVFFIDERMEGSLAKPIRVLASDARVVELSGPKNLVLRNQREGGAFEEDLHHHHGEDGHHHHDEDDVGDDEERSSSHGCKGTEHDHGPDADDHEHDCEEADHDHDQIVPEGDYDGSGTLDLHIWPDPVNAIAMVEAIETTLAEVDPGNASAYNKNAHEFVHELEDLTKEIKAMVAPVKDQPFLVFHDAYRYFEDRFGLAAVGSASVSEDRAPSVKRIRDLRNKVRELGVVCVFSEAHFDQRLVETIIEGTEIRKGILDSLGVKVEDGPELYFTTLRDMATSAIECLSPEGGS